MSDIFTGKTDLPETSTSAQLLANLKMATIASKGFRIIKRPKARSHSSHFATDQNLVFQVQL
jgi:hypothetical protein